ncbi:hypothetical protein TNCT_649091 [Trichonephila clavata]|uniref:Uncharacterized protein n=1 Tax=Trichonephila clavata TaxID=2740835 RepID=A0A8X6KNX2_TRICU|nr:hypothetical protein TNCT_649091 [Trichonephila clavata]
MPFGIVSAPESTLLLFFNFRFLRKMAKKWKKKIPTIKHKKNAVKHLKQQKNILESAESKNIDLSEICAVLDKKTWKV